MKNYTIPACRVDTPENYFVPNPDIEKEIPIDAVRCSVARARAVLELLMDNGHDMKNGLLANHETLINALWLIDGILDQAETMLDYPLKKEGDADA